MGPILTMDDSHAKDTSLLPVTTQTLTLFMKNDEQWTHIEHFGVCDFAYTFLLQGVGNMIVQQWSPAFLTTRELES